MNKSKKIGVAVKAVVFNSKDQVLLLHKSETEEINPNTLDIPGGRIEFGESPIDALNREIMEEIGVVVEIIGPSRVWSLTTDDLHLVGVSFATRVHESDMIKLSDEHTRSMWINHDQIDHINGPSWIKKEVKAAYDILNKYSHNGGSK